MTDNSLSLKGAEATLAQASNILEQIGEPFIALDTDWCFAYANVRAAQLFGCSSEELKGRNLWVDYPGVLPQHLQDMCHRSADTQQQATLDVYLPHNDQWYECNAYPMPDGLSLLLRDITERINVERSMLDDESLMKQVLDNITGYVSIMSTDGILLQVNSAALEASGLRPKDVLGKHFADAYWWAGSIDKQERLRAAIERAAQGESIRYDVDVRAKDEQVASLDFGITPIFDEKGNVIALVSWALDISGRVQDQKELEAARDRLSLAVRSGNIGLWEWDLLANTVHYSRECRFQLGYGEDEIPNHFDAWRKLVHPDEVEEVRAKALQYIERPNQEYTDVYRMQHKDGSYRWILASASLTTDDQGNPVRLMGSQVDITEQRKAVEALRESEEHFRLLVEMSPYAIYVFQDQKIVFANESALKLFGAHDMEQLIGTPMRNTIHPDSLESTLDRVQRLRKGEAGLYPTENSYVSFDGRAVPVEVTAAPFTYQGREAIQVLVQDISARKQAEESRRLIEERYRFLFENMLNGFALCRMSFEDGQPVDFVYLDVNKAFEELTGLKDVVGKKVSEVIPGIRETDPELFEIYGRVAMTGEPETFETYLGALNMWFLTSVYSPENEYFVAVFDVITERKRAEHTLREQAQQLSSIYDAVSDLVFYVAVEGNDQFRYVSVNPSLLKAIDMERDQVVGKPVNEIIQPSAWPGVLKQYRSVVQRKETLRWEETTQLVTGTMVGEVSLIPVLDEEDVVTHIVGTVHDITERVEAEYALRDRARQQELLVEITRAALAAETLPDMLQSIADSIGALMEADACYITLWDESAQIVKPAAAFGWYRDGYASLPPFPAEQSLTALALEKGSPIVIEDYLQSPYRNPNVEFINETMSQLTLPLIAGDQRLGAAIIEYSSHHQFTEHEIERGRHAAEQISLAIAKGLLVEKAERNTRELRALSTRLITAQEDERREIARELHDEIGQILTSVKTMLSSLQLFDDPKSVPEFLQSSIDVVNDALKQIRNMALALRPSILDDFGLGPALNWFVNAYAERTNTQLELQVDLPDEGIPLALETTCFRIVQSALTNVERHSQATEVEVIVRKVLAADQDRNNVSSLELIVRDNGQGFDVESVLQKASQGSGMGLLAMQERARLSGGTMRITSQPTVGTEIRASLPLAY